MAEEFRGGACGGSWWNPSIDFLRPSPCLSPIGWLSNHDDYFPTDVKTAASISDGSLEIQNVQNPRNPSDCSTLISDEWSQGFLNDTGKSDNYPNSITNYQKVDQNVQMEQQTTLADSLMFTSTESAGICEWPSVGFPLDDYNSSVFQMLSDEDFQSLSDDCTTNHSSSPKLVDSTATFWNSLAADSSDVWGTFRPSIGSKNLPCDVLDSAKPNAKHHEELQNLTSEAKRHSYEPAIKRPRIETPSPLPIFKVRKEKLGDRITALQQLVSPFGKTDTASVLHEAIGYIKFLHEQVIVLTAPISKRGSSPLQHQQAPEHALQDDQEGLMMDLKGRGLCLVPISSTLFPLAAETCSTDFWKPIFGGSFM